MKFFLRGIILFVLVMGGIVGVMTVDVRTGHMAGYQPAIDMIVREIPAEVPKGTQKGSQAVSYNFTIICNKELFFH